jgi:hypothetical protein
MRCNIEAFFPAAEFGEADSEDNDLMGCEDGWL